MSEHETTTAERPVRRRRPRRRPFEVGRALSSTFGIWARNIAPLTLFALVVYAPLAGLEFWIGSAERADWATWAELPLEPLLDALLAAPVIGMVVAQLRGQRQSFTDALGPGLARVPRALGAAILVALLLGAIALPGLWLTFPANLLVAIPLLVVSCGLLVAVPAAVVERPGIFAALRRSWSLTSGNKARIFVVLLLLGLAQQLAIGVLGGAAAALGGVDLDDSILESWWAGYAGRIVFGAMTAVLAGVTYHDLRVAVEGIDPQQIEAVFD
jgi:hypothetical protein